jgi:hypothetical protein
MIWWARATDAATLKDRLASKPQQLDYNGDCEPIASRGSDACKVAALPSSLCQCFVDNIPVLGSVDSVQDDRGIRRAVYRLETRHRTKIARVGDHRRHYA